MKIPIRDWAARNYNPPPSDWVLRRWARDGEIIPAPERVGKGWYVDEHAQRAVLRDSQGRPSLTGSSLVDRLIAEESRPALPRGRAPMRAASAKGRS